MIIGGGDIASVLKDRDDLVFFASGVSNSLETRKTQFQREENLLMTIPKNKHVVYFGSLSIFYLNTPYTEHKRKMEALVKSRFQNWTIVRLGNPSWGTNPNTIINYFKNRVKQGLPLEIRDEHRYIVEEEEFLHWIGMIPRWNETMNITGQYLSIKQIVDKYVYGR